MRHNSMELVIWTGPDASELTRVGYMNRFWSVRTHYRSWAPTGERIGRYRQCKTTLWPGHPSGYWRRFQICNVGMRILIQCWGTKCYYKCPSLMSIRFISLVPDAKLMVAGWRGINTRVHTWRRTSGNDRQWVIRLYLNQRYASTFFQVPVVLTAKLRLRQMFYCPTNALKYIKSLNF